MLRSAAMAGISFPVSPVVPAEKLITPICSSDPAEIRRSLASVLGTGAEACSVSGLPIVNRPHHHPLVAAADIAFSYHYPMVLSPDMIWTCLVQGMAQHVNANVEKLRQRFVQHEGRLTLQVRRDDFVSGSPDNPWPEVFSEFSRQIQGHIGELHGRIVADFSTTGPLERAVSEMVLMDMVKAYFTYEVMSLCGIPSITLEGTPDDWRSIQRRAEVFAEVGLAGWLEALRPVLEQFCAAAEGHADQEFWRSFFKLNDASGGPFVTGWINVLFPYLKDGRQNSSYHNWSEGLTAIFGGGPTAGEFPSGVSVAPFIWEYLGERIDMRFAAGFFGVCQVPESLALRPELGWAVLSGAGGPEIRVEHPDFPGDEPSTDEPPQRTLWGRIQDWLR